MSKAEKVPALFAKFNCAQAVFAACGPYEGLSEPMCLAVAGPFGGGMGRMGETCGAVTGGLMVLGVRDGQEMATNPAEARGPLYAKVNEFVGAFKEKHGSMLCREITGCDLRTAEGQEAFKKRDHKLCEKVVISAVELLEEK